MTTFNQKNDSGALFVNDRKTEDRFPDWTGSAKVVCQKAGCGHANEVYVNAWVKNKDGKEYFSLSFRPKAAATETTTPANDTAANQNAAKPSLLKRARKPAAPAPK